VDNPTSPTRRMSSLCRPPHHHHQIMGNHRWKTVFGFCPVITIKMLIVIKCFNCLISNYSITHKSDMLATKQCQWNDRLRTLFSTALIHSHAGLPCCLESSICKLLVQLINFRCRISRFPKQFLQELSNFTQNFHMNCEMRPRIEF
jgi:hypothetical protein